MSKENRPKVGVGVIVVRNGKVLLGKRMASHGIGTWSLPGGHLEFGESIEECAARETREETALELTQVMKGPYTNDVFEDDNKHYVTLFVIATSFTGEPQLMEPEKCSEWRWFDWGSLPDPLFLPVRHLVERGYSPFAEQD